MSGMWDYAHTIIVGPRTRDGTAGYHVITPLVRSNGTTVLVDRGFVSKDAIEKFTKAADTSEEVFVQGMLRVSQVRNSFTPDNHPEKGEWYWIDADAMAEYAGGEKANVQPVLVEEIFGTHSVRFTVVCCLCIRRGTCRRGGSQIERRNPGWKIASRRNA